MNSNKTMPAKRRLDLTSSQGDDVIPIDQSVVLIENDFLADNVANQSAGSVSSTMAKKQCKRPQNLSLRQSTLHESDGFDDMHRGSKMVLSDYWVLSPYVIVKFTEDESGIWIYKERYIPNPHIGHGDASVTTIVSKSRAIEPVTKITVNKEEMERLIHLYETKAKDELKKLESLSDIADTVNGPRYAVTESLGISMSVYKTKDDSSKVNVSLRPYFMDPNLGLLFVTSNLAGISLSADEFHGLLKLIQKIVKVI